jgi:phosphoserine phosphatase RsbU/P
MKNIRRTNILLIAVVCTAVGLLLFNQYFDAVSSRASVDFDLSRSEIINKARSYLIEQGFEPHPLHADAVYWNNTPISIYLQFEMSPREANAAIRDPEHHYYYWIVTLYDRSLPRSIGAEEFQVHVASNGDLVGYSRSLQANAVGARLSEEEAMEVAMGYIRMQGIPLFGYNLQRSASNHLDNRTDWEFLWQKNEGIYGLEETIRIRVQGDMVGTYMTGLQPPKDFMDVMYQDQTSYQFSTIINYTSSFLLFFFIVVIFLKRYHEGEVGIQTALMVLIGVYVLSFLDYAGIFYYIGTGFGFGQMNLFNVRIVMFVIILFIILPFLHVMTFAGWSVGESYSRSLWNDKLTAFDALLQRKFFALPLGVSVVRGYGYGMLGLGVALVVISTAAEVIPTAFFSMSLSGLAESFVPGLQPILQALWVAALCEIVFRLFIISYFKARWGRTWIGVVVSIAIWTVAGTTVWVPMAFTTNMPFMIAVLVLFGSWFTFLFLRYDLVTAMTANFITVALAIGVPLYVAEGTYFTAHAVGFTVLMGVPFVIASVGVLRGKSFQYTADTIPAHIKRISQRERMAKELEIARSVQMSLLPKETPNIPGFDIAGICIPAQEVGGDYFDYVTFENGNLGIAVGDVSGKGVPAAIYMTLTKGVLQSHAEAFHSPKDVLTKVNYQLYGTIERNTFVSMVYAVFDVKTKTMRYARAGHNPVILAHLNSVSVRSLVPKGMALGLDRGSVFERSLEENSVSLKSGDILTFYTDGFTEARRTRSVEFGQEQFTALITRYRALSARQIVNNVIHEIRKFRGDYPQHDDMTMVIVKVL